MGFGAPQSGGSASIFQTSPPFRVSQSTLLDGSVSSALASAQAEYFGLFAVFSQRRRASYAPASLCIPLSRNFSG